MDIGSLAQIGICLGRVSHPHGKWYIAPTTNFETLILDLYNTVMDPDKELLNPTPDFLNNDGMVCFCLCILTGLKV
jgi:hypothetical protein